MRTQGKVDSAAGHVPGGHLCWAYSSRSDFHARATEYLLDGVAESQWIEYVGTGSTEALRAELLAVDALAPIVEAGGIAVTSVADFYAFQPDSDVVDPEAAVTARIAATKQALADGYSGFRAVVDATAMARTPRQREAFARFEHLIDHTMSTHPVTALCGYNLRELSSTALAELACLHPLTNLDTSLQLYAEPDGNLTLAGTIDQRCAELFTQALGHAAALAPAQEVVLNAQHLSSIEASQLLALNRLAHDHDRKIALRCAPSWATHLIQQLDLTHLRSDDPEPS